MLELHKDNFAQEVEESDLPVAVEFWGEQCGVCLALAPEVEKLAERYQGRVKFRKIAISASRRLCLQCGVMTVPTFLFYKNGVCASRLSGRELTPAGIRRQADALLSQA
jgi:thioredoxin 1